MGWLFAVAIGLQDRSRAALLRSLLPIALGHALAVGAVVASVELIDSMVARRLLAVGGGVVLIAFGLWRLRRTRHLRWVGMRLTAGDLVLWSFLVSSAHGAGLMLFPLLVGGEASGVHAHHGGHGAGAGLAAVALHSAAMLAAMAVVAVVVYEVVGLDVLRRAWLNLDRLWALVLVGAGAVAATLAVLG